MIYAVIFMGASLIAVSLALIDQERRHQANTRLLFEQIQHLVDKIRSQSFESYAQANRPIVPRGTPQPAEPPDDLRILQGFQL